MIEHAPTTALCLALVLYRGCRPG